MHTLSEKILLRSILIPIEGLTQHHEWVPARPFGCLHLVRREAPFINGSAANTSTRHQAHTCGTCSLGDSVGWLVGWLVGLVGGTFTTCSMGRLCESRQALRRSLLMAAEKPSDGGKGVCFVAASALTYWLSEPCERGGSGHY